MNVKEVIWVQRVVSKDLRKPMRCIGRRITRLSKKMSLEAKPRSLERKVTDSVTDAIVQMNSGY